MNIADSSRNLHPMIFINQDKHDHFGRNKKEYQDEEIGVFRAEKYFNGTIHVERSSISSIGSRNFNNRNIEGINLNHVREKFQPRTPSVCSESSWNSQSALIQNDLRNRSKAMSRKGSTNGRIFFFSSFGIKCSCSDKNAVGVKEDFGEISFSRTATTNSSYVGVINHRTRTISPIKAGLEFIDTVQISKPPLDSRVKKDIKSQRLEILGTGLSRESCFNNSNSEPEAGNLTLKSTEVFGSPVREKRNRSLSLDKRLTKMSWDATIPRVNENEQTKATSGEIFDNDSGSETSSDLFELESLTNKTNPFVSKKGLDDTSGCATPTTCYAPSEASIEWSVVTAGAADFSAMSDCEDHMRSNVYMSSPKKVPSNKSEAKNGMINKEMQRRRSGTFLGCKSNEAVKVAGNVHRTFERPNYDQLMRGRSDSFMDLTRSQAEKNKLAVDINSRVVR